MIIRDEVKAAKLLARYNAVQDQWIYEMHVQVPGDEVGHTTYMHPDGSKRQPKVIEQEMAESMRETLERSVRVREADVKRRKKEERRRRLQ